MARKKPSFYAVHKGRQAGVYESWDECQDQIDRFPGAIFKGFQIYSDALQFVRTGNAGGTPKYHAVAKGWEPGVYTSWARALEQINLFNGPRYEAFETPEEAIAFVTEISG